MTTIRERIRSMLRGLSIGWIDRTDDFEQIVRDIVREEIRFAEAAERDRRQRMLADIRAGRPVDAFVNRGENPHGNSEPKDSTT